MKQGGKCILVGQGLLGFNRIQFCNKVFFIFFVVLVLFGMGLLGGRDLIKVLGFGSVERREIREEGQVDLRVVVYLLVFKEKMG